MRALLDRGANVTAVVRRHRAYRIDERATVVETDLFASDTDLKTLAADCDVVVHLAWAAGFAHNAPTHMTRLSAHFALLDELADHVERLVVIGTMHEVGFHRGAVQAETPTEPLSLYGVAKDALRRACMMHFRDRVELTWLRAFYIFGDDRNNQSVFTKLLEAAERGDRTFPFTSGTNAYDFIDVRDLAAQIATASLHPKGTGIINVCSGEATPLGVQVERFIADHGLDIALEYGRFPDRPYDSPAIWGDDSRIRELMNDDQFRSVR